MVYKKLLLGMLVMVLAFGMSVVGCDNTTGSTITFLDGSTTSGRLTITGLPPEFNGRYIMADGGILDNGETIYFLAAAASIRMDGQAINGSRINNGQAALNVWAFEGGIISFYGDGFASFDVYISNSPSFPTDARLENFYVGDVEVTFQSGIASGAFIPDDGENGSGEENGSNDGITRIIVTGITENYSEGSILIVGNNLLTIAGGYFQVSNGSLTAAMQDENTISRPWMPWTVPWTGRGTFIIQLVFFGAVNDTIYFYTGGKSFEELGIDENTQGLIEQLPRFNVSEYVSTIPFDKFRMF